MGRDVVGKEVCRHSPGLEGREDSGSPWQGERRNKHSEFRNKNSEFLDSELGKVVVPLTENRNSLER